MSLHSSFTDFSLAELFQLIDQGQKSGRLTVCTFPDLHTPKSKSHYFYIWFKVGRIVAATNGLNGQGLLYKVIQRGWANQQVIEPLFTEASHAVTPVGLSCKTQGLLSSEQLNLLFASQLQQIRTLFEIQKGVFKLDSKATFPWNEMTGLSLRATEVALMALRILKNWEILAEALPEEINAIQSITSGKPQIRLNPLEWQVWEFANGSVSINEIASKLNQPIPVVQQAAFRLMIARLVDEVPVGTSLNDYGVHWSLVNSHTIEQKKLKEPENPQISTSFLQNLVGFLKSKV
ncbi:DUF4388 domain-containing protein [Aetokthonos hydrillicola Thurmond2011]|jgi:hypothetical protein|uniref:DUF4388 domain-containing protein n=1 Tax=Aetokthonos hydrillicola Thurmond2011 TaxID=2712845 RepID=A0AAP5I2B2_9CYAN|nr:DUF4388 domain-containing protein [Aetokthonos hydrillicola]MBO3462889.1 DUF4388 domain-containing protein [Aetokthonos hydrillicola CCALA 1050]MBW4588157.1 DUF4388 domain-containing protein [Aetokthonos hydrillicola CCALA 1050]MDR9893471.1 DUF4388 domain-containing protein [Aetokthonos hydrillicola Thurmond2011]